MECLTAIYLNLRAAYSQSSIQPVLLYGKRPKNNNTKIVWKKKRTETWFCIHKVRRKSKSEIRIELREEILWNAVESSARFPKSSSNFTQTIQQQYCFFFVIILAIMIKMRVSWKAPAKKFSNRTIAYGPHMMSNQMQKSNKVGEIQWKKGWNINKLLGSMRWPPFVTGASENEMIMHGTHQSAEWESEKRAREKICIER